jgi:hypothetical protein
MRLWHAKLQQLSLRWSGPVAQKLDRDQPPRVFVKAVTTRNRAARASRQH